MMARTRRWELVLQHILSSIPRVWLFVRILDVQLLPRHRVHDVHYIALSQTRRPLLCLLLVIPSTAILQLCRFRFCCMLGVDQRREFRSNLWYWILARVGLGWYFVRHPGGRWSENALGRA